MGLGTNDGLFDLSRKSELDGSCREGCLNWTSQIKRAEQSKSAVSKWLLQISLLAKLQLYDVSRSMQSRICTTCGCVYGCGVRWWVWGWLVFGNNGSCGGGERRW